MKWLDRSGDAAGDIEFFLAEETAENIARGMTPEEARLAAQRKFGNRLRVREEVRTVWVPRWIDDFALDFRYTVRTFWRAKLFTVAVLSMMALSIGINTVVFSLVNSLLLRPLPYPEGERLVVYSDEGKAARFKSGILVADFAAWRERIRSFDFIAGYQYQDSILSTTHQAATVKTLTTAGEFWRIAGVRPALGRLFGEDETTGTVVLSHRVFTQFFSGDPSVVGSQALLAGTPVTITGVLPPDFRVLLPQERGGLELREPDVFQPAGALLRGDRRRLSVVGRLRPDMTAERALSEVKALQSSLIQEFPDRWFAGVSLMKVQPLRENLASRAAAALTVLQIAGLLVLLIACSNIAGLLLARGLARKREISIRIAIGAGRGRLMRQYLSEGLLLAIAGGASGVLVAWFLLWAMHQWGALVLPRLAEAELDGRVLLFTTGLSLLSALLFSFWPAVGLGNAGSHGALRSHGATESPGSKSVRMGLVSAEFAIAVVLAVGAGLMIRSYGVMNAAVQGFEPRQVLVMRLSLAGAEYKEKTRAAAVIGEVEAALRSIPGVVKAGLAERQSYLLQSANSATPHIVDRFDESLVTPEYFAAIGMRLVRGRWIEARDAADAAVINESLARRAFGTGDPIGQPMKQLGRPVRVVGVAADLKYSRMDQDVVPELFRGYAQNIGGRPTLFIAVRVEGDPALVASSARKRLAEIAPMQAIHGVETLEASLSDSIAPRRLNLLLMLGFASVSIAMAAIGIYGVVAYSVTQRTHEIGIRRALGASGWQIAGTVLRCGLSPALAGIAAGSLGAIGLAKSMASLVYGVEPLDMVTFLTVPIVLAAAATAACLLPAARATRIDPMIALRLD